MGVAANSDNTTNTLCTSCINWGSLAKAYDGSSTNRCTSILNTGKITDCQIYNPGHTDTVSTTSPEYNSCLKCEKSYYNVRDLSNGGNMTGECSDSKGTGCTGQISNCWQTICYSHYSSGTIYSSQLCYICKSNHVPAELDIWDKGAKACVKGSTINNCKYEKSQGSASALDARCYACNKNFALFASGQACAAFTSDENCMEAADSSDGCMTCWNAYYFGGKTCMLTSNIIFLGLLAFIGLVALY